MPQDSVQPGEWLPLEISKGCRFGCKFCFYDHSGTVIKSPECLKQELLYNYKNFGTTGYQLTDDTVNDSMTKIDMMYDVIKSLPFNIEWIAYTRPDMFHKYPQMLDKMLDMGCRGMFLGVETFNHTSQQLGFNNAGKEFPEISSGWKIKNQSASYTVVKDTVSLPQGKTVQDQLNRSLDQNFTHEQIVRQARGRYNQMYSNKLTLTIAGDVGVNVGDIIYCDFAEITSDKRSIKPSTTRSGLYMITDLCHRLTTDGTWSRLHCVRDSFGRKPMSPTT